MPERNEQLLVSDMPEAIDLIRLYTKGLSYEQFIGDRKATVVSGFNCGAYDKTLTLVREIYTGAFSVNYLTPVRESGVEMKFYKSPTVVGVINNRVLMKTPTGVGELCKGLFTNALTTVGLIIFSYYYSSAKPF